MTKKEAAAVDLSQSEAGMQKQNEGILVEIMSMDGRDPLGFSIRIAGPDSDRAREVSESMIDEKVEAGDVGVHKARERAQEAIKILAHVTLGWEPQIILDKKTLDYSPENAALLYTRLPFVCKQVNDAFGDRSRFLEESRRPSEQP